MNPLITIKEQLNNIRKDINENEDKIIDYYHVNKYLKEIELILQHSIKLKSFDFYHHFNYNLTTEDYENIKKYINNNLYNDSFVIDEYLNIDCKNCNGCVMCKDCIDCIDCTNCERCVNCIKCNGIRKSENCENCDRVGGYNLKNEKIEDIPGWEEFYKYNTNFNVF